MTTNKRDRFFNHKIQKIAEQIKPKDVDKKPELSPEEEFLEKQASEKQGMFATLCGFIGGYMHK